MYFSHGRMMQIKHSGFYINILKYVFKIFKKRNHLKGTICKRIKKLSWKIMYCFSFIYLYVCENYADVLCYYR